MSPWIWIGNLLVGAGAAGAVTWLARTWLGERLKQSIAHEYSQHLERHKSELGREVALAIERTRSESVQDRAVRALGEDYLREAARVTHAKRIEALHTIWSCILRVSEAAPEVVVFVDVLTVDETRDLPKSPNWATLCAGLEQVVAKTLKDRTLASEARLLAGEKAYRIYAVYSRTVARAVYISAQASPSCSLTPWYLEPQVRTDLAEVLSPEKSAIFSKLRVGWFSWLRDEIELAFIARANEVLVGAEAAVGAVAHARAVENAGKSAMNS